MGQVFARRKGQRVQIGDAVVVIKRINRRWVELYVDAPCETHVKGLNAEPQPEPESVTTPCPVPEECAAMWRGDGSNGGTSAEEPSE